jgi:hypothetical protein
MKTVKNLMLSLGILGLLCIGQSVSAFEMTPTVSTPDIVKIGKDDTGKDEICQKEPGKSKCKGDGVCQKVNDECHSCDAGFFYQTGLGCYKCEKGQSLIQKFGTWTCSDGR